MCCFYGVWQTDADKPCLHGCTRSCSCFSLCCVYLLAFQTLRVGRGNSFLSHFGWFTRLGSGIIWARADDKKFSVCSYQTASLLNTNSLFLKQTISSWCLLALSIHSKFAYHGELRYFLLRNRAHPHVLRNLSAWQITYFAHVDVRFRYCVSWSPVIGGCYLKIVAKSANPVKKLDSLQRLLQV